MRTYARVSEEMVHELFSTDGNMAEMFHPDMIWADVTDIDPMPGVGWTAIESNGVWSFAPYIPPPPTEEQILLSQSQKLQILKHLAEEQKTALTSRIGVLNDAVDLEMASDEEIAELPIRKAQLIEWKRYAILLGRVTTQEGWPPEVEWPVQPVNGMDLTLSAVAPDSLQLQ